MINYGLELARAKRRAATLGGVLFAAKADA
jgi:hypothetical protein